MGVAGFAYPGVDDISTDLDDPPPLARAPDYPAEFVPIVREAYPGLAPCSSMSRRTRCSRPSWS